MTTERWKDMGEELERLQGVADDLLRDLVSYRTRLVPKSMGSADLGDAIEKVRAARSLLGAL